MTTVLIVRYTRVDLLPGFFYRSLTANHCFQLSPSSLPLFKNTHTQIRAGFLLCDK